MIKEKKQSKGEYFKWKLLSKKKVTEIDEIIDILLENRGLKGKIEKTGFFNPPALDELQLKDLGIEKREVKKAIERILKAKKSGENIIVYGDYDVDGICATAILWECLYYSGLNALPYIPERFSEGYGLNSESIEKLKKNDPKLGLIISVDNGIVAHDAVMTAKKLDIDVIITDHHEPGEKYPKAFSVVHTTKISGSGVSWFFSKYLSLKLKPKYKYGDGLELAALGTIADQLPLIYENRSLVKKGLERLNRTTRIGLKKLISNASLKLGELGTYSVNFVIAPRLNAMGRLKSALESLRLICETNTNNVGELSTRIEKTNTKRQQIVEEVVLLARKMVKKDEKELIVIGSDKFHEGVIGLAASRLVEEFNLPAIVFSFGKDVAKASARSVSDFNITKEIKKYSEYLLSGGGHKMAAGFSIKTKDFEKFKTVIVKNSREKISKIDTTPTKKADMELELRNINWKLVETLKKFEPYGIGNMEACFVTNEVSVLEIKIVGSGKTHLKLILEKDAKIFDAIAFSMGEMGISIKKGSLINIYYSVEENIWNGSRNIQLKIKDLKILST